MEDLHVLLEFYALCERFCDVVEYVSSEDISIVFSIVLLQIEC